MCTFETEQPDSPLEIVGLIKKKSIFLSLRDSVYVKLDSLKMFANLFSNMKQRMILCC